MAAEKTAEPKGAGAAAVQFEKVDTDLFARNG